MNDHAVATASSLFSYPLTAAAIAATWWIAARDRCAARIGECVHTPSGDKYSIGSLALSDTVLLLSFLLALLVFLVMEFVAHQGRRDQRAREAAANLARQKGAEGPLGLLRRDQSDRPGE